MVRTLKLFAFVSLLSIIQFAYPTSAKAAYGDWTIYAAYHHATKVAVLNKIVYVLSDNGLYSYDPEDTHVETYDKTNVLSDNHIINMVYCDATKQIVLLYGNGNIDMMDAKGNVYNMPELKGKALPDKTLNDMYVRNENVYISTNSGIVVLDTKRKVFANYYDFGQKVNSMMIDNGTIYAATPSGVYKGLMKDNLLDAKSWVKVASYVFTKIMTFNSQYYACTQDNKLKIVQNKETFSYKDTTNDAITDYCVANDMLLFFGNNNIIIVDKDNKFYDSRNDCNAVIETATNTLVIGSDKTVIPDGVTKIATAAFSSCQELQTVVIPNSVKRIGKEVFSGCVSLASVTLPEGLDEIEAYTFANCGALTSIVLPSSLTSIGEFAFSYSGLKSITIPASVWNIEVRAFDGCRDLTTVENKAVVPQTIYDGTFSAFKKLIVPEESADAYRKSPIWSNFAYINGVATGIDDLQTSNDQRPSSIYNLSGKRLDKASKGVNIIKGKKILVK